MGRGHHALIYVGLFTTGRRTAQSRISLLAHWGNGYARYLMRRKARCSHHDETTIRQLTSEDRRLTHHGDSI